MNVEHVNICPLALLPPRQKGLPPDRGFDYAQHRILFVQGGLVRKIHAGGEPDVDATRHQPDIDVRSHWLVAATSDHRTGLDGIESENAGVEGGSRTAPAAKLGIEQLVCLLVGRMIIAARRICLPEFDKNIAARRAECIEHSAFNTDALARRVAPGDDSAKRIFEDLEPGLLRN